MRTSTARRVVLTAMAVVGAVVGCAALAEGTSSAATSPAPSGALPQTRDPLLWPFARASIWNTPIGRKARYVPARIGRTGFGVDVDWFVVTKQSDPAVSVHPPGPSGVGRCTGAREQPPARHKERLPRSFLIPDTARSISSAFLQPDRKTLVSYGATARCAPGGPLYGRWSGATSLYGDGITGGHGGSGMSTLGGSIRTGELTGSARIRHALKLEIPGRFLFYDAATGGKRWPAITADAGAPQQYRGQVEALRMGALLALPPTATAAGLGVRSAAGRKVLVALRDFGGYVVDDSGSDAVDLSVEHWASVDFRKRAGHAVAADAGLRADMTRMVTALAVVDDNSASAIGGRGARRTAWAPPFRRSGAPARDTAPAPVAQTTPPAAATIKAGRVAELEPVRRAPAPMLWALVVAAVGLLCAGLWGGRRLAGGAGITARRGF